MYLISCCQLCCNLSSLSASLSIWSALLARLVRTGSIFRSSFSSVFSFSFVSHCPLACRDTRRCIPSPSASFVRWLLRSFELPFERPLPSHSPHPFGIRPLFPLRLHRSSRPAVAMAYQAMHKSWFKMPAYSAVYNPAKKDIEAGDKSTKRQQRSGGDRWKRLPIGPARCIRITQLCCRASLSALSLRVPAAPSSASVQSSSTRASYRR